MRHLISVFPDVGLAEFEAGLEAQIHARGWRVLQRLEHPQGSVFPALSPVLAQAPHAQAWTFFEPVPVGVAAPSTVMHVHAAALVPWNAPLLQALSLVFGGWGLGLLSDRQRDEHALGVFHVGCCVEGAARLGGETQWHCGLPAEAPPLQEDSTWQALAAHYRSISGAHESGLRWSDRSHVRSWVVAGRPEPAATAAASALAPGRLRRAAFIHVDAAQMQAALAPAGAATASLRYLERAAPVTQTPYVLLDGEFDDAWFTALAWRLDAPAAAVDLRGPDGRFTWCAVGAAGSVRAGADQGARALAGVWGGLAVMLGEPASIVRWPRGGG